MARDVTVPSVSPYLAFPPLPLARRFISVALVLKSPSPDVIRRPALRCPDFPHRALARRDRVIDSDYKYYTTFFLKRLVFLYKIL